MTVSTRQADEIEITPEMIEAGAISLAKFDRNSETTEEGAVNIFTAMMKVLRPATSYKICGRTR